MKKILRSAVAVLMILALMAGYATTFASAATATLSVVKSNLQYTANTTLTRVTDGYNMAGHVAGDFVYVYRFGSQMAYCIEPGAPTTDGYSYSQYGKGDSTNDAYWDELENKHPDIADAVAILAAIGDAWNSTKDIDRQAVVQIIMNEITCGLRDPITGEVSDTRLKDNLTNAAGDRTQYWVNRYNQVDKLFKDFSKISSFMYDTRGRAAANPLVLNWNDKNNRYEVTVTDTNGMLSSMPSTLTSSLGNGVQGSRSGNVLTLWTETPIEGTVTSTKLLKQYDFATSENSSAIIWGFNKWYGDTKTQAMISNSIPDPASGYLAVKTGTPPTVTINGQKTWIDANDQDGIQPDEITVRLLADGAEYASTTTTEADGWRYSFTNLPKFIDNNEVVWTIAEDAIAGYEATYDGYNIINTHTPETTIVGDYKTWNDGGDRDGKRPDEITVRLLADGVEVASKTVTEADDWAYSFEGFPKYRDGGIEIIYTVTEDPVDGYETTYDGLNIINSYTPETITISGEKIWDDNNNQDGKRTSRIVAVLYADGVAVDYRVAREDTGWRYEFADLYKYRDGGIEIVYEIKENSVPNGYVVSYDGYNIINTYTPETTEVTVTKTWEDGDNQDGKRAAEITVRLFGNGVEYASKAVTEAEGWQTTFTDLPKYQNGVEVVWTITEDAVENYETSIDGFNITNTYTPETTEISGTKTWDDNENQDGKRPAEIVVWAYANGSPYACKTVTEADGWQYTFTDLPKYNDGVEIVWTIDEEFVEYYSKTINGYDITNSYTPEQTSVGGVKTWSDDNDRDGLRVDEITVNLLADGVVIDSDTTNEARGWRYEFTGLPMYKDGGVAIVYTVEEAVVPNGYTVSYDGFNMTNTHVPELTEVSGVKSWDDDNDRDGIRSDEITVNLLADGVVIQNVTTNEAANWAYTFSDLLKYRDGGIEIVYTVEEAIVPEGYTVSYDGFNMTNTHAPELTEVSGVKSWDDDNDRDGIRSDEITVNLLADGIVIQSVTTNEAANWAYSFTDLLKYRDGGVEIVYTVEEAVVPEGYTVAYDGFNMTNTHAPELTEVRGKKIWVDDNNRDGLRVSEITVNLLADGELINTVTTTEADNWVFAFTDLYKYRDGGIEIVYTVEEAVVPEGYTVSYDGYNIINTHEIEKITISGQKIWNDGNDAELIRPEAISVALYADGVEYAMATVTAANATAPNTWSFEFADLPANRDDGTPIVYTIAEKNVPEGYTATVEGFTLTNTHEVKTPDTPKTGDTTAATTPVVLAVMAFAAAGVTATMISKKRKKTQAFMRR